VTSAEEALEVAKVARQASERTVAEARACQEKAANSVETAKASLASFEPERMAAEGVLCARVQELERFVASNVASFTALRDKVAKPLEVVEFAATDAGSDHAQASEAADEVKEVAPAVKAV